MIDYVYLGCAKAIVICQECGSNAVHVAFKGLESK